ncbi:heavy metal-associated isoprenylated plant protein 30-like [Silene latifolia]|uniref:heavy metal-associated isoprenylated plant protein 30-like n=1 Tax=Silene latifolia TaxID=37657 RepID=UPI003D784D5D
MARMLKRSVSLFISAISNCFFSSHNNHTHPKRISHVNNYYYNMPNKSRPLSLQTVELKVRMCCTGCERVVRDAILKLRGVDSVDVELKMEKVTVVGYVDRNKVLKAVRRAGKRTEFWPYPNPPLYFTSSTNYFKDLTNDFKESYNYYRHGYNVGDRHGTIPVTSRGDDNVSNMFNDDNVHACRLM